MLDRLSSADKLSAGARNLDGNVTFQPETAGRCEFNYRRILGALSVALLLVIASVVGYNTTFSEENATHGIDAVTLISVTKKGTDLISKSLESLASIETEIVAISVTNEYSASSPASAMFRYPFLQDAHLMEPYRESTVTITGLSPDCGVAWLLSQSLDSGVAIEGYSVSSDQFKIITAKPGKFNLRLSQDCTGNNHDFTVYVKYVRRELSTLTVQDREDFLDAMHTLWTVSTTEGKKIYGDRYKSHAYLSVIHNDGQDNGYCDQFHDGPGFFTSHMYLQAYLEQSMQLVNPRTCLHYWEFTKDFGSEAFQVGHFKNQLDGGSWSQFMTDKWFGQSDPLTGRIINGRWEDAEVPFMNDAFFEAEGIDKNANFFPENDLEFRNKTTFMHSFNPYGFLRSAWDFNPSKYLTRYHSIAGIKDGAAIFKGAALGNSYNGANCEVLESFMQGVVQQPLTAVTESMVGSVHSAAHWTLSGYGGELSLENDAILREQFGFTDMMIFETTYAMVNARASEFSYVVENDETSIFQCSKSPFDFDSGTLHFHTPPGQQGGIQCPFRDKYFVNEAATDTMLAVLFTTLELSPLQSEVIAAVAQYDWQQKIDLARLLESKFPFPSDIGISSSVTDPLFWVLHGSLERLFQLLVFSGSITSMEYDTVSNCAGHDMNTPKNWLAGFYLLDESVDVSKLTQKQLQDYLNPLSKEYELLQNFVYDSGDWQYCPAVVSTIESARSA